MRSAEEKRHVKHRMMYLNDDIWGKVNVRSDLALHYPTNVCYV